MYKLNFYHSNTKSFFTNNNPQETKGLIGNLCYEFRKNGDKFWAMWFDKNKKLKTDKFQKEVNEVVEELQKGLLKDRNSFDEIIAQHPNSKFNTTEPFAYGMFIETKRFEYAISAVPLADEYTFEIMCYDKRFQPVQYRNARRFRDENGELTKSVKAIAKATMPESKNYYIDGDRYENQGKTYTFRVLEDDMLFESADGEKVFVVPEYLGTFLPDIASEERAFSKVPLMQTLSHLTLRELLETANMNDVHLTHSEEEIDLATVVELHKNTLTEEGKREWADVLDAKVERIYDGAYGTQLECSGISPTRLSEFSFMLSGECPAKDFDKWVNDNDSQEQKMDM